MDRSSITDSCVSDLSHVLQGNGHERDFLDDRRVFIMDMYNRYIYPRDGFAKSEYKNRIIFSKTESIRVEPSWNGGVEKRHIPVYL